MTRNNLKIAVTGGIGSGKSTVSKIIEEQGYKVFSCDEIYKSLLCDEDFLARLSEEFGDILDAENNLDRKKLSSIVFSDEQKLERLNSLTHPEIMRKAFEKMSGEGIYFCEVPLLFEHGYEGNFDKVIVVLRNKDERITAVTKRDGLSEVEVKRRINSQFDYDNTDFAKYYVIYNNSNLANLRSQTLDILKTI